MSHDLQVFKLKWFHPKKNNNCGKISWPGTCFLWSLCVLTISAWALSWMSKNIHVKSNGNSIGVMFVSLCSDLSMVSPAIALDCWERLQQTPQPWVQGKAGAVYFCWWFSWNRLLIKISFNYLSKIYLVVHTPFLALDYAWHRGSPCFSHWQLEVPPACTVILCYCVGQHSIFSKRLRQLRCWKKCWGNSFLLRAITV